MQALKEEKGKGDKCPTQMMISSMCIQPGTNPFCMNTPSQDVDELLFFCPMFQTSVEVLNPSVTATYAQIQTFTASHMSALLA